MKNLRIKKAKECLTDAEVLFKNKRYNACISRCYYCIFHCVFALLDKYKIPYEKREHRFVASAFAREFIHRIKMFKREDAEIIRTIFRKRVEADYEMYDFSEIEVKRVFDKTKNLYYNINEKINGK